MCLTQACSLSEGIVQDIKSYLIVKFYLTISAFVRLQIFVKSFIECPHTEYHYDNIVNFTCTWASLQILVLTESQSLLSLEIKKSVSVGFLAIILNISTIN